jgi:hypothetical protein
MLPDPIGDEDNPIKIRIRPSIAIMPGEPII